MVAIKLCATDLREQRTCWRRAVCWRSPWRRPTWSEATSKLRGNLSSWRFFPLFYLEKEFLPTTNKVHPFLLLENFLLQVEVDEFTKSVLSNPENQDMARRQERQKFIANPLAVIDQEVGEILREIYKAIIFLFQFYAPASSPKVSVIQMAPSPMRSPRPL